MTKSETHPKSEARSEEMRNAQCGVLNHEWAARSDAPLRSVFGNYVPANAGSSRREEASISSTGSAPTEQSLLTSAATAGAGLQSAIDSAIARSFLYRFLAQAYEDPKPESWQWLCSDETQESLQAATRIVAASRQGAAALTEAAENLQTQSAALCRDAATFDSFSSAYVAAFGHAARGSCPLNELEYGDLKADPLFQPHRLADLAAFYRAFALELTPDATERHDHLCIELEFMSVLAAKEAYALEHQFDHEVLGVCGEAQKKFLREHLGRWVPALARRLSTQAGDSPLGALAAFTRLFVESECRRFDVRPGSEDLWLRPVDEGAESLCASCGLSHPLPGAVPAEPAPG